MCLHATVLFIMHTFYDKGCCTRINEMMPREPYGGMKAFKTFTKSLAVELLRESIRGQLKTIDI